MTATLYDSFVFPLFPCLSKHGDAPPKKVGILHYSPPPFWQEGIHVAYERNSSMSTHMSHKFLVDFPMSIEHVLLIMCYVMTMTPTTLQATKQLNQKKKLSYTLLKTKVFSPPDRITTRVSCNIQLTNPSMLHETMHLITLVYLIMVTLNKHSPSNHQTHVLASLLPSPKCIMRGDYCICEHTSHPFN